MLSIAIQAAAGKGGWLGVEGSGGGTVPTLKMLANTIGG